MGGQEHGLSGEAGGGRGSAMRSDHASVLSGSEWNGFPNARVVVTSVDAGALQLSGSGLRRHAAGGGEERTSKPGTVCKSATWRRGQHAGGGAVWDPRAQAGAASGHHGPVWSRPAALPLGSPGSVGVGGRPQAERSRPLSSVLGLPEESSLQWAGAALQLTVSYLWF